MRVRQVLKNTGVEGCLNLLLNHLYCPPCLTSVAQDWFHIGVEDEEFGSHADSSRCPDVFEHILPTAHYWKWIYNTRGIYSERSGRFHLKAGSCVRGADCTAVVAPFDPHYTCHHTVSQAHLVEDRVYGLVVRRSPRERGIRKLNLGFLDVSCQFQFSVLFQFQLKMAS